VFRFIHGSNKLRKNKRTEKQDQPSFEGPVDPQ